MLSKPTRAKATSTSGEDSYAGVQLLLVVSILCLATLGLLASPVPTSKPSTYPAWWFQRDAIARLNPTNSSPSWPSSYPTSDDYAVINQGQLKNFATQAYNELLAQAPTNVWSTTPGTNLTAMVTSWNPTNGDGYAVANLGQLKTVAKPFYDVLGQIGYANTYPWTGSGADDYATANIGQVKHVFSFDVGYDSDSNGLPDWWEILYFGSIGNVASAQSAAGDGYTNLQEYQMGRNPIDYYQGITPTITIISGNNQTVAANTFASSALVVQVKNGSTALVSAPVTFSIASGSSGAVAATSGGNTFASVTVLTDGSGDATIYYQGGPEVLKTNTITATATDTSAATNFTANCGISGLNLWLKADAGVTQSSGNVSAWADQTGTYTVTQSTTGTKPTYVTSDINGYPGLHFNGSQWLYNSSNMGLNADLTIISVAETSTPHAEGYTVYLGNSTSDTARGIGYFSNSEVLTTYADYSLGTSPPNPNAFVTEAATLNSARTQVNFYRNGVSTASSVSLSNAQNMSAGITVGAYNNGGAPWQGDIAEVLVFNRKLSDTELQEVEVYLADKYGLYNPNATWPETYSTAIQGEITRNQWNKSQTDAYVTFLATNPPVPAMGLVTWLKADTGVTQSSGNVSAWADQSPNGNNAVQSSSGNKPTLTSNAINTKPTLTFNGSTSYMSIPDNSSLRPANITILTVAVLQSVSAYTEVICKPYRTPTTWSYPYIAYAFDLNPSAQPYFQYAINGTLTLTSALSSLSSGTAYLFSSTYDSATGTIRENGGSLQSFTSSGPITNGDATQDDLTIGVSTPTLGHPFFNGKIAEILIYNRALTDSERQQAENYLIDKYNLDGNHALLSITPAAGSYGSTQTIAISAPSGTIHYTIDGTTPTASSPTYTTSFSLSSSALVQAATFSSGVATSAITTAQFYINDTGNTGLGPVPGSVAVSTSTVGELDLSWTLSGTVTYSSINVYRSTAGGAYQLIATLAPGTTTYADLNVVVGTNYQYEVGTFNQSGVADSSATSATSPTASSAVGITVTTPSSAVSVP